MAGRLSSGRGRQLAQGVLARAVGYARGWRCREKIVVIESDDWGSIRTSSAEAYQRLKADGHAMEKSCYSLDALETEDDLRRFFAVLGSVRDRRDRPACCTANMVMANPDFERIRASGFTRYVYTPVQRTLSRCKGRERVVELWRQGLAEQMFVPQFHAREHVAWWHWLRALRQGSPEALATFELGMCGVPMAVSMEDQSFFTPLYLDRRQLTANGVDQEVMVAEGLRLFRRLFGFQPLSTVAPNVSWTDDTEAVWAAHGIRFIQGGRVQEMDTPQGVRHRIHWTGERSRFGGRYLTRNCTFEPARQGEKAWESCLAMIEVAFRMHQPAIVCSHRVNYIGSIVPENRERSLAQLEVLLRRIVTRWPKVVFLSSPELGKMIEMGLQSAEEVVAGEVFSRVVENN